MNWSGLSTWLAKGGGRAKRMSTTLLRLPQGGPEVAVVVLGAKSNAGRFWETRHLFNWLAGKRFLIAAFGGKLAFGAARTSSG